MSQRPLNFMPSNPFLSVCICMNKEFSDTGGNSIEEEEDTSRPPDTHPVDKNKKNIHLLDFIVHVAPWGVNLTPVRNKVIPREG